MGPSKKPMKKSNSAKKIKNSRKTELKKKTTFGKAPVKKIASAVQKNAKKSDSPKTKSGKKMEVTAKPSSTKAKSTSVKGGQKKERSKPVIVIKSVDVTESTAKETGETSKKKEEEEEVRKEMSVYDEGQEEVVKMQKISIWRDLATFVKSRLGSIDSSSVPEVCWLL